MAITIMPAPYDSHEWMGGDHLRIVGDVEEALVIPAGRPTDCGNGETLCQCYYIAVSDGSFIRATNDAEAPDFVVIAAGRSGVLVADDGLAVSIPGEVSWVALSSNKHAHAFSEDAMAPIETMPLFQ